MKEVDGYTRTALHLAVESGKDWDSGVNFVFEKYPDAILKFDGEMKTPFFSAALKSSYNSRIFKAADLKVLKILNSTTFSDFST